MFTYETDPKLKALAIAGAKVERATGFPNPVFLTQSVIESTWGQSVTGDFNFGGIKRIPEQGKAKLVPTTEELTEAGFAAMRADERATMTKKEYLGNGKYKYHMSCWFASYASVDEYAEAYEAFLVGNSRYLPAWHRYQQDKNVDSLLIGIAKAGYATGAGYQKLELTIEHQANIQHACAAAMAEVSK